MSTLTLAHQIAECLGEGWTACTGDTADGSEATLRGPDDQVLVVFSGSESHRKSDHGRLFITGDLGRLRSHVPHGVNSDHKITVAESKPPDTIAEEVRRRLLPDYQAVRTAAWEAKQVSDAIDAAREQLAATVATSLEAHRRREDSDVCFGTFNVGVYGSVNVHRGDDHSVFTVHVPLDRVADFGALLNAFRRQH